MAFYLHLFDNETERNQYEDWGGGIQNHMLRFP